MPNVTARYWGIGRHRTLDGSTMIGELEFYQATAGDVAEVTQLSGTTLFSDWLSTTALAPALREEMDGSTASQGTITQSIGRRFGIALDCVGQTEVRFIILRNANDKDAASFIPFAIDDPNYFLTHELSPGKIKKYAIFKFFDANETTINYLYTILPVAETVNPSIARGSITKGVC